MVEVETGSGRGTRPIEGTSVASNLFTCSRSESGMAAASNGADGSGCQALETGEKGGGRGGRGGEGGKEGEEGEEEEEEKGRRWRKRRGRRGKEGFFLINTEVGASVTMATTVTMGTVMHTYTLSSSKQDSSPTIPSLSGKVNRSLH